jgi:hypothetical protein
MKRIVSGLSALKRNLQARPQEVKVGFWRGLFEDEETKNIRNLAIRKQFNRWRNRNLLQATVAFVVCGFFAFALFWFGFPAKRILLPIICVFFMYWLSLIPEWNPRPSHDDLRGRRIGRIARPAGLLGGLAAGAYLGSSVGLALGPLGAIAGTIPGALVGGIVGYIGGSKFGKKQRRS